MTEYVRVQVSDEVDLLFEASGRTGQAEPETGIRSAGAKRSGETAIGAATQLARPITVLCEHMIDGFRQMDEPQRPSTASIEFGLALSVEGNVYVVKGGGEASVTVRAEWSLDDGG